MRGLNCNNKFSRSDNTVSDSPLICPLIFSKTLSIMNSVSKGSDMANSYLSDETITRCESGSKEEKVSNM